MGFSLGIDTSNYKTSVAITDKEKNIVFDKRILLNVKDGEKGLRQQEALFQHINNLPILINEAMSSFKGSIDVVSASNAPRNVDGSYMPCFLAGTSAAKIIASSLGAEYFEFSHQEGHIRAGLFDAKESIEPSFIAFHFSGGTLEALLINDDIKIIGGTKDISFGQLIDRIGVYLGLEFPCGEYMDEMAFAYYNEIRLDSPQIKVESPYFNLSGMENTFIRIIDQNAAYYKSEEGIQEISYSLFSSIGQAISKLILMLIDNHKSINSILLVGGVSESVFLRNSLTESTLLKDINLIFCKKGLSGDNGVGISLLGGDKLW